MRWRIIAGGARVIQLQCIDCGRSVGSFVSQKDKSQEYLESLDKWDDEMQRRDRTMAEERHLANVRQRQQESDAWWANYEAYLRTPEWQAKRKAVLERDKHLCQGCLKARAIQAHHQTYVHLENELLFELISLCKPCHDRNHDPRFRRSGPPILLT